MSRLLPWLVAVLGVAGASAEPLPAADTWWLLASGRFLVETGQILAADPFAFTSGPWFNHEWLFGLGAYWLHQVAGWEGLYGGRTLCLVLAFALVPLWAVRQNEELTWATGMLAAGYSWLFRSFYDVRPYLATYLLTALCLLWVRAYLRTGARRYLVGVVVATAVWANLHGAFILGPGMLFVAGLGCWLEGRGRAAAELGVGGLAGLLAALGNPYGPHMLAFPFSLFGASKFRLGLNEWVRPELFGAHAVYWAVVAVGLVATFAYWRSGQRALALLTLVFLLGGFTAWRNLPLACLAGVQLHAVALRGPRKLRTGFAVAALVGALLLTPRLATAPRQMGLWDALFPGDAGRFLQANPGLPRRLCNPYEWGGWLTWHLPGWRIMIDGRAHTVYSEEVYVDAMAIQFGGDWEKLAGASWQELLRRYQCDLVLVTLLQGDLDRRLKADAEFTELYRDRKSAVYLRRGVAHPPLVYPETSDRLCQEGLQLLGSGDWENARQRFERAVQLGPGDARAHLYLGVTLLRAGQLEAGEAALRKAIALQPNLPDAHYNLGLLYRLRGDGDAARREMQAELTVNPAHAGARKALLE